jgi:hypothetical protein
MDKTLVLILKLHKTDKKEIDIFRMLEHLNVNLRFIGKVLNTQPKIYVLILYILLIHIEQSNFFD